MRSLPTWKGGKAALPASSILRQHLTLPKGQLVQEGRGQHDELKGCKPYPAGRRSHLRQGQLGMAAPLPPRGSTNRRLPRRHPTATTTHSFGGLQFSPEQGPGRGAKCSPYNLSRS